jgi:hypothetical protein
MAFTGSETIGTRQWWMERLFKVYPQKSLPKAGSAKYPCLLTTTHSKVNSSNHQICIQRKETENYIVGIGFTNASVTSASEIQRDLQPFWQAATPQFLKTLYRLYPKTDYEGSYSLDNNLFLRPIFTAIATMFGLNEQDTAYWQLQAISGDYVIKCPTRYVSGSAAKTQIPIWKLIFNRGYFAHGAIAPYILGAPSAPLQFNNTLAVIMEDCWLSSIINLDPNSLLPTINSTNQPKWPRYGADATIIQVNETSIQPMTDSDASEQCDFCQQTLRMSETR